MDYFAPVHQFEIRYSKLLNFSHLAQDVLAPFIPFCRDVQVEHELTRNAKYSLLYDNYNILIQHDRLLFRFEGEINNLLDSGSIVQEPFFAIYKKLSETSYFGTVRDLLMYTIYVRPDENATNDKESEIIQEFSSRYINVKEANAIVSNLSDISLVLETKRANETVTVAFGPYFGVIDLNNRGQFLVTQEMLERCAVLGQMCELKVLHQQPRELNFALYKSLYKTSQDYVKKLWKQD